MPKYNYVAMDSNGKETKGTLEVASQNEAIGRVKEMGLFPTKDRRARQGKTRKAGQAGSQTGGKPARPRKGARSISLSRARRQGKAQGAYHLYAPIGDARGRGLPLLRGLRVLESRRNIRPLSPSSLNWRSRSRGSTFSEGLAQHPKVFNRLFVNMVKAGELGGVLEVVLARLAEFMEKPENQGQVIAAMFYPVAVLIVATGIMLILRSRLSRRSNRCSWAWAKASAAGVHPPGLGVSRAVKDNILVSTGIVIAFVLLNLFIRTKFGRHAWDKFKLKMPAVGRS